MEAQLCQPVVIIRGQLNYGVPSQRQIVRAGIAIVIGGEVSVGIALGISHPKCPAAKLIAGVGGLVDLDASVMGVGEGDFCGLTDCNRYRLHSGVKFPIGIVRGNLFRIIGSLL